jgi:hypothetical protein
MSHYLQHREFYNNPVYLTEEQKANPVQVFCDFFVDYHFIDIRQLQAEVTETCLTTDMPPFDDAEERANFLSFQRKLISVLEAAAILAKQSDSNSTNNISHVPALAP